jgi:ParB/RepB/Spo0J family partition protein
MSAGMAEIRVVDIVVGPERMRKLRPEVVDELADSISAQGLLQPIIVRPRGAKNFWLIAGRHRLEAIRNLGHEHVRAVILDGLDADQALLIEIDENLMRAELSAAERALHVGQRKEIYERLHPETKLGATGRGRAKNRIANVGEAIRFTKDAAKKTGKSERSFQREAQRAAQIIGLADVVGTSLDQGDELDALAKLPEPVQRDLIARAKAGERVDVKVAVSRQHRARRVQELAVSTLAASEALGQKLYGVLYIDPPWQYREDPMGDVARAIEEHYPTMSLDEIRALPVPAADDCCLFLWTTVPMLADALTVMTAWGFTYKTTITWVKDKFGIGYWVRSQCEHLLVGIRGDVPTPARGEQLPAVVGTPRLGHSEKPDVFAEHIDRVFPNVPKLEMFARKSRPNWDVWGNEAPTTEAAE